MSGLTLKLDVIAIAEATGELQLIRAALTDRRRLNAAIATDAETFTKEYVSRSGRHRTAERLGATPTGFRARAAQRIESGSDNEQAFLRIPRNTGLGRAFGDVLIRPRPGRKYLTIPGVAETYGKTVRDFPENTFAFTIMAGRYPVLVFREGNSRHRAWTLAFWLRREVRQKQDRSLLPSDAAYLELGRRRAVLHIASLRYNAA